MKTPVYQFHKALPVWQIGKEWAENYHLCFTLPLPAGLNGPILALGGATSFTVSINGQFIAYGPARSAHGYYRVDQIALTKYLSGAGNVLSIRVAGYVKGGGDGVAAPSFLCAELTDGDKVIAYTAPEEGGFYAYAMPERIRSGARFSASRPFLEQYILGPAAFSAERGEGEVVPLFAVREKKFLLRTQPYADYPVVVPRGEVAEGQVDYPADLPPIGPGFSAPEAVKRMGFTRTAEFFCRSAQKLELLPDTYADIDLGRNYTGIPEFYVESPQGAELYLLFDELFGEGGSLDPFRQGASGVLYYRLSPGVRYHIHTAEPYSLRALRIFCHGGPATLHGLKLFKLGFPSRLIDLRPAGNTEWVGRVFAAAAETFSATATDIFMNNPGRDRAGSLIDAFFLSRTEKLLTGASRIERTYLENYILSDPKKLPGGLMPPAYPAEYKGEEPVSPEYSLWFILQLGEYYARSEDDDLLALARPRVASLLRTLSAYENGDGLLENTPGRLFLDAAYGDRPRGQVNFILNMLYMKAKAVAAHLYGEKEWGIEAEATRSAIRHLSLRPDGLFADALYDDEEGHLLPYAEASEVCQYYAFFTGVATPEEDGNLLHRLVEGGGMHAGKDGLSFPTARQKAGLLPGRYLRFDLLSSLGASDSLRGELCALFSPMAEKTGTLWEGEGPAFPCLSGAASSALCLMTELSLVVRD